MKQTLIASIIALFAVAASAQQANPAQNDMMQQLQKMMGKKDSQEALGQMMVVGSLLGCTQKTAGKEATNAFYTQMKTVGKTAEIYCKQGNATEARALLLSTFDEHKNNVVVKAALGCYDAQTESIAAFGGARVAKDAANYARWLRDPELAKREMKETDICRGKPKAPPVAAPVDPVQSSPN